MVQRMMLTVMESSERKWVQNSRHVADAVVGAARGIGKGASVLPRRPA